MRGLKKARSGDYCTRIFLTSLMRYKNGKLSDLDASLQVWFNMSLAIKTLVFSLLTILVLSEKEENKTSTRESKSNSKHILS